MKPVATFLRFDEGLGLGSGSKQDTKCMSFHFSFLHPFQMIGVHKMCCGSWHGFSDLTGAYLTVVLPMSSPASVSITWNG